MLPKRSKSFLTSTTKLEKLAVENLIEMSEMTSADPKKGFFNIPDIMKRQEGPPPSKMILTKKNKNFIKTGYPLKNLVGRSGDQQPYLGRMRLSEKAKTYHSGFKTLGTKRGGSCGPKEKAKRDNSKSSIGGRNLQSNMETSREESEKEESRLNTMPQRVKREPQSEGNGLTKRLDRAGQDMSLGAPELKKVEVNSFYCNEKDQKVVPYRHEIDEVEEAIRCLEGHYTVGSSQNVTKKRSMNKAYLQKLKIDLDQSKENKKSRKQRLRAYRRKRCTTHGFRMKYSRSLKENPKNYKKELHSLNPEEELPDDPQPYNRSAEDSEEEEEVDPEEPYPLKPEDYLTERIGEELTTAIKNGECEDDSHDLMLMRDSDRLGIRRMSYDWYQRQRSLTKPFAEYSSTKSNLNWRNSDQKHTDLPQYRSPYPRGSNRHRKHPYGKKGITCFPPAPVKGSTGRRKHGLSIVRMRPSYNNLDSFKLLSEVFEKRHRQLELSQKEVANVNKSVRNRLCGVKGLEQSIRKYFGKEDQRMLFQNRAIKDQINSEEMRSRHEEQVAVRAPRSQKEMRGGRDETPSYNEHKKLILDSILDNFGRSSGGNFHSKRLEKNRFRKYEDPSLMQINTLNPLKTTQSFNTSKKQVAKSGCYVARSKEKVGGKRRERVKALRLPKNLALEAKIGVKLPKNSINKKRNYEGLEYDIHHCRALKRSNRRVSELKAYHDDGFSSEFREIRKQKFTRSLYNKDLKKSGGYFGGLSDHRRTGLA